MASDPTVLNDQQIAYLARRAGFVGDALVRIVAIVLGESGGDYDIYGDTGITTEKWGPSTGLAQIRSLRAQRGTGATRDELANLNPAVNLQHAYEISGGGTNFQPWSVWTSGTWRQFEERARAAVRTAGDDELTPEELLDLGQTVGPGHLWDEATGAITGWVGELVDGLRKISLVGLAVGAGVGLVVLGLYRGTRVDG